MASDAAHVGCYSPHTTSKWTMRFRCRSAVATMTQTCKAYVANAMRQRPPTIPGGHINMRPAKTGGRRIRLVGGGEISTADLVESDRVYLQP